VAAEETVELGTNLVATASRDGVALLTTSLSDSVSRLHYGKSAGESQARLRLPIMIRTLKRLAPFLASPTNRSAKIRR
jgi:hypothetical protein